MGDIGMTNELLGTANLERLLARSDYLEPEIAILNMYAGLTDEPLWPICLSCGSQLLSTNGRDAAT